MKFHKVTTKCGAPLYVFPMRRATSVACAVLVNVGTRDERPGEHGLAHANEHMMFQGNDRLPNSRTISAEIENIGGQMNARTGQEMTSYFNVVPDDAIQAGVNSLASMLSTPLYRAEDIATEMKTISEEISKYQDTPDSRCAIMFNEAMYGTHPLGKNILGTRESVLGFRRENFLKFHGAFYHPANYTFVAIGNTTVRDAVREFDRAFAEQSHSAQKHVRTFVPLLCPTTRERREERTDIGQANVVLGTPVGGAREADPKALDFYATMIGGGMSFPLFQEVRDKYGLCYYIGAGVDQYSDCGAFYANLGTGSPEKAVTCIHEVIERSCTRDLFSAARSSLIGGSKVSLSSSPMAILFRAVHDIELTGKPLSPEEILAEIEAQTFEGVEGAVQRHLLDREKYCYAYVVPGKGPGRRAQKNKE